ncbi:MAG TPA: hypothetical protein ENJ00_07025 [Phycisphaerales bacterium]|nr:hypothetical protein [Phycisphaerales bacterium]
MAYLLASTLVVFLSLGDPVRVTAEGYREGVRMLITAIAIGITIMWPMLRLSQASPVGGGGHAVARDLMILLIPLQAVLWPQTLLTGWTFSAIGAAALTLLAWSLLVGALVAAGLGFGQQDTHGQSKLQEIQYAENSVTIARTLWMLAILTLVLAGPLLMVLIRSIGRGSSAEFQVMLGMSSPLTAPWELLKDRVWTGHRAAVGPEHWRAVWMTLSIAVAAWVLRALWRRQPSA